MREEHLELTIAVTELDDRVRQLVRDLERAGCA